MKLIKAVIFDTDGVLVDSESLWAEKEPVFYKSFFGEEIAGKIIGKTLGADCRFTHYFRLDSRSRFFRRKKRIFGSLQ